MTRSHDAPALGAMLADAFGMNAKASIPAPVSHSSRNFPIHYHVYYGQLGCLPDDEAQFTRIKDAHDAMRAMADGERSEGKRVKGNVQRGYSVGRLNRIWCERCADEAHLTEDE